MSTDSQGFRDKYQQTVDGLKEDIGEVKGDLKDVANKLEKFAEKLHANNGALDSQQRLLFPLIGVVIVGILGAGAWAAYSNWNTGHLIGQIGGELKGTKDALVEYKKNLDKVTESAQQLDKATDRLTATSTDLKTSVTTAANSVDNLKNDIDKIATTIGEIHTSNTTRDESVKKLGDQMVKLETQAAELSKDTQKRIDETIAASTKSIRDEVAAASKPPPRLRDYNFGLKLTARNREKRDDASVRFTVKFGRVPGLSAGAIQEIHSQRLIADSSRASADEKATVQDLLDTCIYDVSATNDEGTLVLDVSLNFSDSKDVATLGKFLEPEGASIKGRAILRYIPVTP